MTRETVKEYSHELLFFFFTTDLSLLFDCERDLDSEKRSSQYMKDKVDEFYDAKISKLMACGVQMDSDQEDGDEEQEVEAEDEEAKNIQRQLAAYLSEEDYDLNLLQVSEEAGTEPS
ncbi:uncharacterized protein ACWYII_040680 isoform 1-T1 [Salvelinus alpinus]